MFDKEFLKKKNFCFVVMPFLDELKPVYQKIVEVVGNQYNLHCQRADDIYSNGIIIKEIWEKISLSNFLIADATGRNVNVFYEMGLAHAIGKEVIIISQSLDDIPFDLKAHRILVYNPEDLDEFAIKLFKVIESFKLDFSQITEWLNTNVTGIRVGLCSMTNGATVYHNPIEAYGIVEGLPGDNINYRLQAFIITDIEYPQDSCVIAKDGEWFIKSIYLGATNHFLFFRIFDEDNRLIAESGKIKIKKISAF